MENGDCDCYTASDHSHGVGPSCLPLEEDAAGLEFAFLATIESISLSLQQGNQPSPIQKTVTRAFGKEASATVHQTKGCTCMQSLWCYAPHQCTSGMTFAGVPSVTSVAKHF